MLECAAHVPGEKQWSISSQDGLSCS